MTVQVTTVCGHTPRACCPSHCERVVLMPDLDRPLPHDPRLDPVRGPWSHPWVAHSHGSPTHAYSPPPLHADIHLWEGSCAPPTTHSRHLSLALQTASLPPPRQTFVGRVSCPCRQTIVGRVTPPMASAHIHRFPQHPFAFTNAPSAFTNAPPIMLLHPCHVVTPLPCCTPLPCRCPLPRMLPLRRCM